MSKHDDTKKYETFLRYHARTLRNEVAHGSFKLLRPLVIQRKDGEPDIVFFATNERGESKVHVGQMKSFLDQGTECDEHVIPQALARSPARREADEGIERARATFDAIPRAILPRRVSVRTVGDGLEAIHRAMVAGDSKGRIAWRYFWLWFWVIVEVIRYASRALRGRKAPR